MDTMLSLLAWEAALSGERGEEDCVLYGEKPVAPCDGGSRMTLELDALSGRRAGLVTEGIGA